MPILRFLRTVALAAALLPAVARAQGVDLQLPATFVAPNFDRVFVGVAEAHEAGAYLVRTGGPAATWYNPAGMAQVDRTSVSVNVRGGQLEILSLGAQVPNRVQVTGLDVLPLFASLVLGGDLLPWDDVRIGFSGTQQTSWDVLAWWGGSDADGHWGYVSDSSLSSYVLSGSVAWAVSPQVRLGAGLGVSWTRLYLNERLTALVAPGDVQGTIRSRLLSGLAYHLVPSAGVQWEPAGWLALGAVVRAPALRVWQNATVQAERQDTTATSTRDSFTQSGSADFDFRYPLELQGGAALRGEKWELELDARYHASSGSYDLVRSSNPVQAVTTPPGGPPVTSPFQPIRYQGRAVVDLALGGSWAAGRAVRLHGGAYASPSPVAAASAYFRQIDLYGLRAGVSYEGERFSGSVGLGWETGRSSASSGLAGVRPTPIDDSFRYDKLSVALAGEYRR